MTTAAETQTKQTPLLQPSDHTDRAEGEVPVTLIRRRPGWQLIDLAELWRFRELLFFLTWRDVKIRYKQTVLGFAWALALPLAYMAVFTLFIGRVAAVGDKETNYWLFVLVGFLPWTFFSNAIMAASNSIVGNERLVTRIYFPRLLIPLSTIGANLVDFAVGGALLMCILPFYLPRVGWEMLLVPLVVVMLFCLAMGVGTLLAALTVAYRDVRFLMTFAVQLWMVATPIIYVNADKLGVNARKVLPLNPTFGLIHMFRQTLLGAQLNDYDWYAFSVSAGISLVLLIVGCLYFRRVERGFADII